MSILTKLYIWLGGRIGAFEKPSKRLTIEDMIKIYQETQQNAGMIEGSGKRPSNLEANAQYLARMMQAYELNYQRFASRPELSSHPLFPVLSTERERTISLLDRLGIINKGDYLRN